MRKWAVAAVVCVTAVVMAPGSAAVAQGQRFPDVPPDHYAFAAVEWAASAGVTLGYGDGTFRPSRALGRWHALTFMERYYDEILQADESEDFTRADMMVLLKSINDGTLRGAGTPDHPTTGASGAAQSQRFPDVPPDHYAFAAVEWAASAGVTLGYGDGTFKPSRALGRWHALTFMERYYDEILQADESEDFTRADMMVLLKSINDGTLRTTDTDTAMDGGGLIATGWCALKTDNTLICWDISTGLPDPDTPSGTFTAVSGYGGDYGGHHCAIRTDRTIACWGGGNRFGQADAPEGQFIAVSANRDFSCAIRTDRTIACWGRDFRGRTDAPEGRFTAVSGACALRTDRTIACWGDYGDPPSGQFTSVSGECAIRTDATIACWYDPLYEDDPELKKEEEPPSGQFTAISSFTFAGLLNYCAIRTDATMACWGVNFHGAAITQPGQFLAVAAGGDHSCAVKTDGAIICWGRHDTDLRMPPGQTIRADDQPTHSVQPGGEILSVGQTHTCGILADGNVSCWGNHQHGRQAFPEGRYLAVSTGTGHSCGLLADQTITCPGTHFPRPATAPAGRFLAVAAGNQHSCGLLTNLTIHCWGSNDDGQLDVPEGRYLAVSAGDDHSCGLRTDQTVTCWGHNGQGRSDAPSGQFLAVSAGAYLSCGLRTDRTVACWGSDSHIFAAAPPRLLFLGKSDPAPSASVLLPRSTDCRQPTSGAGAPGPPADLQIVRLDTIDRWGRSTRSPTVGWTSPCSGGPVDRYIVQWRRGHEEFDSARQQTVLSVASTEAYSAEIADRLAYEIRVAAVSRDGQSRHAQLIVPTQANEVYTLLKKSVFTFEDRYPWLSEAWAHINSPDFFAGSSTSCKPWRVALATADSIHFCTEVRAIDEQPASDGLLPLDRIDLGWVAVHEMAHVYHDLTDLAVNPPAIAAGWVYLSDFLKERQIVQGGDCRVVELYADVPLLLMSRDGLSRPLIAGYWQGCARERGLDSFGLSQEGNNVMRSVYIDQEVPQWFYDTYQRADGSWDVEAIKTTLGFYVDADRPGPPNALYWQLRQLIPDL